MTGPVGTAEQFSRPYGTQINFTSGFPSHKWLGYCQTPLTGRDNALLPLMSGLGIYGLEIPAAIGMAAIAIKLYGVARAFA